MKMMNKYLIIFLGILSINVVYGQGGDVEIVTDSDRSITPAKRIFNRPQIMDTAITARVVDYPLLVLKEKTDVEIEDFSAANIRLKPQLSQLYKGYVKLGLGSLLQPLGEVYYNSLRSRKFNWGIHALHHSEWGKIKGFAPSQYDNTSGKVFGKVIEKRFSYGGELNYRNQGLHYYGFENSDAPRDSISQRYSGIGFNAFFDSHKKDSSLLNFKVGVEYNNFLGRKPKEDTLKDWRGKENFAAIRTHWEYNGSTHLLLANLGADFDISYNDYRYGLKDTFLINPDPAYNGLDSGLVTQNVLVQLRPVTNFYGLNKKLYFKVGGELSMDWNDKFRAYLYPLAEVRYSLFNDIFIPYVGVEGGLKQQRYELLARENEFINANNVLRNASTYTLYGGFKGTITSRISFNASFAFANVRDKALFVNDTIYSSGNQFRVEYDTLSISTIAASISYQQNEKLKIDLIGKFHSYQAKNNPYAWNLPQFEIITRGSYNIASKLIATLDFKLETGRKAQVFDTTIEGIEEQDGVYYKKLGVIPDLNIGVEFRYSKRLSIWASFNNIASIRYRQWYDYPVNGFQGMAGITFRF